jgi:hypothetical protein
MERRVQEDEMSLQPHVLIKPFEKWALDFEGPIFLMSRKKKYILVCTDYVTKWVEPKPLLHDNEQIVVDFYLRTYLLVLVSQNKL